MNHPVIDSDPRQLLVADNQRKEKQMESWNHVSANVTQLARLLHPTTAANQLRLLSGHEWEQGVLLLFCI